jgi:hypothetical protein
MHRTPMRRIPGHAPQYAAERGREIVRETIEKKHIMIALHPAVYGKVYGNFLSNFGPDNVDGLKLT